MKFSFILLLFMVLLPFSSAQTFTSQELLQKSIQYHDPGAKWSDFKGKLIIDQLGVDHKSRGNRVATIDLSKNYFKLEQTRESETIIREIKGDKCQNKFNGSINFSDEILKKHQLTCERANMYRNYYSYLYGLPMKLKDPGTIIHPEVKDTDFEGQESYAIKVTYEKEVGEDIWYFYFDKSSYAMIGYRFYHDEAKNDGEYIILKGEITIEGVKMPKDRYWYTHKENKFLGADLLKQH